MTKKKVEANVKAFNYIQKSKIVKNKTLYKTTQVKVEL